VTAELGEQIWDDWGLGEFRTSWGNGGGGLGGGVASRNGGGEARRSLGSSCRKWKSGEELGFRDFGDERWSRIVDGRKEEKLRLASGSHTKIVC
jgi:hypothetical protein